MCYCKVAIRKTQPRTKSLLVTKCLPVHMIVAVREKCKLYVKFFLFLSEQTVFTLYIFQTGVPLSLRC